MVESSTIQEGKSVTDRDGRIGVRYAMPYSFRVSTLSLECHHKVIDKVPLFKSRARAHQPSKDTTVAATRYC
jgi:hypothetical protein